MKRITSEEMAEAFRHLDKNGDPVNGFWRVTTELSHRDVDRDWVFSDLPSEVGVARAPRLAWGKGHLSVSAVVEKRAVPAESQDMLHRMR